MGRLRLNAFAGISSETAEEIKWLDKGLAICGCVALGGRSIVSEDVQHNRDERADLVRSMGIQAYACEPLQIGEKTIGTLSFGTKRRKGFTEDELALMSTVADQVSVAIERKQAETALRVSRTKLKAALASMTDAVFISDDQGRFIDFNDAFATFHRFKNKDECSRTFAEYPDILDVFMADGTLAPVDMWAVPRALRGETATDAEYILRRKDTGETWVGSYSFAPIRDKDGAITGSVVIGRDITERKRANEALHKAYEQIQMQSEELQVQNEELQAQSEELQKANEALLESEERFRTLAENSPDIIARFDRQNRHTYANPAAAEPYSRSPKEIVGRTNSELGMDLELVQFWERHYKKVFTTGKPETMEFQHTSPQGKKYYFNTRIVPEFVDGEVASVLAHFP